MGLPAISAASPATAAAAAAFVVRGVYAKGPAIKLSTIHVLNRVGSLVLCRKRDKAESTAATSVPVRNYLGVSDFAISFKRFPKARVISSPAKATHKNLR